MLSLTLPSSILTATYILTIKLKKEISNSFPLEGSSKCFAFYLESGVFMVINIDETSESTGGSYETNYRIY